MKYSILGFNQRLVIEQFSNELDIIDLLLLSYIRDASASERMEHYYNETTRENYVWLYHKKILDDLPILNIKEARLKQRISKLVELELLKCLRICDDRRRGSKSFYKLTNKVDNLIYERVDTNKEEGPSIKNYTWSDDQVQKIIRGPQRPSVKNYTSNSILVKKDNTLNIDNSKENSENFTFGSSKKLIKKENLYTQCISHILDFTEDKKLQDKLKEYLDVWLKVTEKHFPNMWKGVLNKLREMMDKGQDAIDILNQAIAGGYKQLYPINSYNRNRRKIDSDGNPLAPDGCSMGRVDERGKDDVYYNEVSEEERESSGLVF